MTKEELEKENETLKGQMSLHEGLLWNDLHKLEKEIAELKLRIDELAKMCNRANERHDNVADSLIKAKEKISNLLEIIERPYQFTAPQKIQIVKEVEQFLKNNA